VLVVTRFSGSGPHKFGHYELQLLALR
jgi:hypothetical protein